MFILLAPSMKATPKLDKTDDAHFTLIVLLFLTVMSLFLTTFFISESRRTRAELAQVHQLLQRR